MSPLDAKIIYCWQAALASPHGILLRLDESRLTTILAKFYSLRSKIGDPAMMRFKMKRVDFEGANYALMSHQLDDKRDIEAAGHQGELQKADGDAGDLGL